MDRELILKMVKKLLNIFVIPKFPEIWEIIVDDLGYMFKIHILVEGTDEEQEMEIEDEIQSVFRYVGEKVSWGVSFHVENWKWEQNL